MAKESDYDLSLQGNEEATGVKSINSFCFQPLTELLHDTDKPV